ncbi:hypothetical protein QUQ70_004788, partial [Escherichia coli]|nr:hypothetical protein [Escherichia coli]
ESTDFWGNHMVECYVIKNEVVVWLHEFRLTFL